MVLSSIGHLSDNNRSEGHQSQLGEFEKLQAERNADDCQAQSQSERGGQPGQRQAEQQEPEKIGQQRDRAGSLIDNIAAERSQRQFGKFEALQTKRDADDRQAAEKSGQQSGSREDKPAQNDPEQITKTGHRVGSPFRINYSHYSGFTSDRPYGLCYDKDRTEPAIRPVKGVLR